MAGDIDVRVMEDGVLPAPEVGTSPDQLEQHGQRQALPPGLGHEHQQYIRAREAGHEDRRLQVHLPTVALPPAGGSKVLLDPPPELELEDVVVAELEASSRFRGSNRLARRARVGSCWCVLATSFAYAWEHGLPLPSSWCRNTIALLKLASRERFGPDVSFGRRRAGCPPGRRGARHRPPRTTPPGSHPGDSRRRCHTARSDSGTRS